MIEAGMEGIAFEVITLLPGFASLVKRSGELDGNLPVRAARYCGPVFEGSAAGFQVVLEQPMTVKRDGQGRIAWDLTAPALQLVTEAVSDAWELGIREGVIERDGPWHRLFKRDALPVRGGRVLVWTGLLIRPRRGLWLLVGGGFNRRSRVAVVDHVASDPERFVPLVIELDARSIGRAPVWLEAELGCVTPLAPRVRMRKERLRAGAPELGAFAKFFSEGYFETKTKHPTATYVRCAREHRVKAEESCDARLLFAGPDIHAIGEFRRFISSRGFARAPSTPGVLQFGVVRNMAALNWIWQGQTHATFEVKQKRLVPALAALWQATVGDGHPSAFEFLSNYALGEQWDQPYVQVQPWVFAPTSAGWSSLVDGAHHVPEFDGMRAVIATDWFFGLAMVFRLFGPASVHLPVRAPLLRSIPIPRAVLELGFKDVMLAGQTEAPPQSPPLSPS